MMEPLNYYLHAPLITFAGGTLTLAALLGAVVVVIVARVIGGVVAAGVRRVLALRGLPEGSQFAIAKIVHYLIMALGLSVAVSSIGLKLDAVLAASTVLLVGIGFGLQDIAKNFISGLILLIEQPVRKGDFIKVGDAYGSVADIGLRATRVVTRDDVTVIVPNIELIASPVINRSTPTSDLRIAVKVGVAYGSDPVSVREVLLGVAKASAQVLAAPAPEVRLDEFGDSSLQFSLLVWIADPRGDLRAGSELRFAIEAAFREHKISIPFPQREIRLAQN